MVPLSRNAAELGIGFRLGLVTQTEIIAWADEVIASLDDPPAAVIDLALMSKANPLDVLQRLSELSGNIAPIQSLPPALSRFAERLRRSPDLGPVVAKGLWGIFAQSGYNVPKELSAIAGFDEDYWLARNGTYGTEGRVYGELLAFFERFEHVG